MKKQLLNLRTLVVALGILFSGVANAFTAVTSGNWSSSATWGGTAPGSNVSNQNIVIPAGITVTLDMDVTFSGLISTFSVSGTLSNSTMNSLTISQGALAGNGTISIRKLVFSGISTASFTGSLTLNELINSSSVLGLVAIANISDSLVLDNGAMTLNTNGNLTMLANSTVRVNDGTLGISGGVFNSGNSYNVMYVGTSKTSGVELNSTNIKTLYIKMNSNAQTVTMSSNTTVNDNLSMTMGQLNFNGRKLTLKGDLSAVAGTSLTSNSSSDLVIDGAGVMNGSLVFSAGSSLNSMTIDRNANIKLASGLSIVNDLYITNGVYSLEAGAVLTMGAGSKIHLVAGNFAVTTGSFVGTASYDVHYMGTTNTTSGIELSGSGLNDVTLTAGSNIIGVTLTNSITVNGKLDLTSGRLFLNGQNLVLNGTLSQTTGATIVGDPNSELHLNLSSAANTTLYIDNSTPSNNTLGKLVINLSGTSDIVLGSSLNIRNELLFVKGKLVIDNNDLVIQSTGVITGYSDTRYVVNTGVGSGRLQMNVNAGGAYVTFPVGTSLNYSPAHIQQNAAATSGNIMIRTINEVWTAGYMGWNNAASSPVVGRSWLIDAGTGVTVNMNMKLGWVAAAELNGFNRNNAMIRHYTNGSWDSYATATATAGLNNTFELSRTGITSLSPFAVADNTAAVGIKNNASSSIGFNVYPNPAKDVLILELSSTMQGYKYEIVDITGKSIGEGATTQNTRMVDVSSLKPGYYFIKVINLDDNVSGVKRFVKE